MLSHHRNRLLSGDEFNPADIAGLEAWWDFSDASTLYTDAGITPVSSDGDLIFRADDKSGNSRNMQATLGAQYAVPYKTAHQNGESAAVIGAADTTNNLSSLVSWTLPQPFTVISVWRYAAGGQTAMDGVGRIIPPFPSGTNFGIYGGSASVTLGLFDTSPHVFATLFDSEDSSCYKDGGDDVLNIGNPGAADLDSPTLFSFTNGSSNKMTEGSWIGEILIYSGAISDSDRESLQNYAGSKWGITITPPTP